MILQDSFVESIKDSILFKNRLNKELDKLLVSYETLEIENIQLFQNLRDHLLSIGFSDVEINKRVEKEITNKELEEDEILSKTNMILQNMDNSTPDSLQYHEETCQYYNVSNDKVHLAMSVSCQTSRFNDKTQINSTKLEDKNNIVVDEEHKLLCACLINQKLKNCGQCSMIKIKWLHDFLKKENFNLQTENHVDEYSKKYSINNSFNHGNSTSIKSNANHPFIESAYQTSLLHQHTNVTIVKPNNRKSIKILPDLKKKNEVVNERSRIILRKEEPKRKKKRFKLNLPTKKKINEGKLINDHKSLDNLHDNKRPKTINYKDEKFDDLHKNKTKANNHKDENLDNLNSINKAKKTKISNQLDLKTDENKDSNVEISNCFNVKETKKRKQKKFKLNLPSSKPKKKLNEKTEIKLKSSDKIQKYSAKTHKSIKNDKNMNSDRSIDDFKDEKNHLVEQTNSKDHKSTDKNGKNQSLIKKKNKIDNKKTNEPNKVVFNEGKQESSDENNKENEMIKVKKFLNTNDLNVNSNTANLLQASSTVESVMSIYNRRFKSKGVESSVHPEAIKNLFMKHIAK